MGFRRSVVLIATLVAIPAAHPRPVVAFICNADNTSLDHASQKRRVTSLMNEALAVFTGDVVQQDTITVRLHVIRSWKGNLPEYVTLPTGARRVDDTNTTVSYMSMSESFGFALWRKYLIFAHGETVETMGSVSRCGPSEPLEDAGPTIKLLDEIAADRKKAR